MKGFCKIEYACISVCVCVYVCVFACVCARAHVHRHVALRNTVCLLILAGSLTAFKTIR